MRLIGISVFALGAMGIFYSNAWAESKQPFQCHQQLYRQGGVSLNESLLICRSKPDVSVLDCQNELFLSFGFSIQDALRVCQSRSDAAYVDCLRVQTLVQLRPQMLSAQTCDQMVPRGGSGYRASFEDKKIYPEYPPVDPSKLTVCSITVNSDNEINAFKKVLSSQGVQFVELTPRISNNGRYPVIKKDWLQHACRQGIRCDSLVVSGHFMGQFGGDNVPFELELNDLTQMSCQSECGGVLHNPTEVYLFGCNTLATNAADSRNPEFYVEVLMGHALTRNQSEMQSARRYLSVGLTMEDQIRASFPRASKIYGFPSVSPLGKNIEGTLTRYVQSLGNYREHLKRVAEEKNPSNARQYLSGAGLIEVGGAPKTHDQICQMTQTQSPAQASQVAEQLAGSGRGLREVLSAYLIGTDFTKLPILSQIARNRLKTEALAAWARLSGMPSVGFHVLNFARDVQALSSAEVIDLKSKLISDRVEKSESPMTALMTICDLSDNHDLSDLILTTRAKDILSRVPQSRRELLDGCLRPFVK